MSKKKLNCLLLSAGFGTRLRPLTDQWPKCLMPIGDRPLLEYWLQNLCEVGIPKVLVNLHHHEDKVRQFLQRPSLRGWVDFVYEETLLGTAGTLLKNKIFFKDSTILLIHADNWCQCDFSDFLEFHHHLRPKHCPLTMMTFDSLTPETCGIVETDEDGIVIKFHENTNTDCS